MTTTYIFAFTFWIIFSTLLLVSIWNFLSVPTTTQED